MESASDATVLHRLNQHSEGTTPSKGEDEVDRPAHGRLVSALTTLAALIFGLSLLSTPAAAASGLKRCPQEVYWVAVDVKGVTCTVGERLAKRAWEKAPQMPLSSTWSGRVGRWSCTAWVNEGGSSQMECRKGSKVVRESAHA